MLSAWPLSVAPLKRDLTAPLAAAKPVALAEPDFCVEPQDWPAETSFHQPGLDLATEEPGEQFEPEELFDPAPAGAVQMEPPAAEWAAKSTHETDAPWDSPTLRLPDSLKPVVRGGAFALCGPTSGLLAEAVEAFLPPGPEPCMAEYPAPVATHLHWNLTPVDWEIAAEPAGAAAAPAAQAVESFLPPFAEPQIAAWPAVTAMPQLALAAADWAIAVDLAEPVAAPGAQPVESFLPVSAELHSVAWPTATTLPKFALHASDWLASTEMAAPVGAPPAEPVESLLPALPAPQFAALPAPAAKLPRFTLSPAAWVLSVDLAGALPGLAPQAVESWLPAAPEPAILNWPAGNLILPGLTLDAADWEVSASIADPVAAPAAQPVEAFLPMGQDPAAMPFPAAAIGLPQFSLEAIAPEPVAEFVPPVVVADASQEPMPCAPACEVECEVVPAVAAAISAAPVIAAALPANLTLEEPAIRWQGDWRPSATAEPVIAFVAPRQAPPIPVRIPVALPHLGALRRSAIRRDQSLAPAVAQSYPPAAEPAPLESPAIAASLELAGAANVALPAFALAKSSGRSTADFHSAAPEAIVPAAANLNPGAPVARHSVTTVQPPAPPSPVLRCVMPLANPRTGEFICQGTPAAPIKSLHSITPVIPITGPKFSVRPVFERMEEAAAPAKPAEKTPAFAEIFEISKAARKTSVTRSGLFSAGKLVAASLIVGIGMWFGFGSVRISRQMYALNNNLHGMDATNTSDSVAGAGSSATARFSSPKSEGTIAKVRHAIQSRASVEFTDSFHRMEAWGSNAAALPAGWSRSTDGYVRTGQLALYRPVQSFTDYRLEFFGEIEKKGMSWAVRAHDSQNYYGMKMTVIEPGLRPVVAMVHYAVVGGKKGRPVQTPLSIMMHNNEPYHIAVNVKGNKVVTSIEGQEVDSWTDDALKMGGVGFFSEVGESARLYWMKVSKNQDWLGRVCAYLSSGSANNTADLWREEIPHAPTQPFTPAPPPASDAASAALAENIESQIRPQRARILKYGRTEICRS